MELDEAVARIAELEGQVTALTEERDALAGRSTDMETARASLEGRLRETAGAHEAISVELAEARRALTEAGSLGLGYLRRALLAELGGQIVPELLAGEDEATLLASVEVAKQAYGRALESARSAIAGQRVPAGAPSARAATVGGLSALEMIESGLRK
jgi:hypothetical protein